MKDGSSLQFLNSVRKYVHKPIHIRSLSSKNQSKTTSTKTKNINSVSNIFSLFPYNCSLSLSLLIPNLSDKHTSIKKQQIEFRQVNKENSDRKYK